MLHDEVRRFLHTWVVERVGTVSPNGFAVCPFALQALLSDKVAIFVNDGDDFEAFADARIASFDPRFEMMILVEDDLARYGPEWAKRFCDDRNTALRACNRIVLCDHPERPGRIGSTITSNGRYLLLFVQEFDRLQQASRALHETNYYADWPADFYDEIVGSRERPLH